MATRNQPLHDERRDGERQRSVFALGKLVCDGREHIAVIRDISTGGLRVEMTGPPVIGAPVVVEMLGLDPTAARVIWRGQGQAGLAFEQVQDVGRMCRRGRDPEGRIARGPRFAVDRQARLRVAGTSAAIRLTNISVGGARLADVPRIDPHRSAVLELGLGGVPLSGYVNWMSGGDAGFTFLPPLDLRTLLKALTA